jgi:methyl-accepting chemotaxis protein
MSQDERNDGEELPGQDVGGAGNVDKIREILFGGQMREYERKFARLEDRLLKESTESREDLKRRFEALEAYIGKEVDSLSDRLKSEQGERAEMVKELTQEVKSLAKAFEKRATQLEEQSAKAQRESRQQLFEQSKDLSEEIRQKAEDLAALVAREVQDLRAEKTDRTALAALLTEMAMRLNNEFTIPKGD